MHETGRQVGLAWSMVALPRDLERHGVNDGLTEIGNCFDQDDGEVILHGQSPLVGD